MEVGLVLNDEDIVYMVEKSYAYWDQTVCGIFG